MSPIPIELYNTGLFNYERSYSKKIIEFLKKNKDNAYSINDLQMELSLKYQTVSLQLRKLVANNILLRKCIGREQYFTYNFSNKSLAGAACEGRVNSKQEVKEE